MSTSVSALSDDRLREFGTRFHGELVRPDSANYDSARKVWNGMIDRRPACIARCRTTADVQAAIKFARENALPIAIRGGGHNAAGLAMVDDGFVIDLSDMRDVVVDPAKRTACAGGGDWVAECISGVHMAHGRRAGVLSRSRPGSGSHVMPRARYSTD